MKKAIIILAVILTSGLTALSVTKSNDKTEVTKVPVQKAMSANAATANLATAD